MQVATLYSLSQSARDSVVKLLFDSVGEGNFNTCRMPLGVSDYSLNPYTLGETSDDYSMTNFSIARDRQYHIPFVKAALAAMPSLLRFRNETITFL